MRRPPRAPHAALTWAPIVLLLLAGQAHADVSTRLVARTGVSPEPGLILSSFSDVRMNASGSVVFTARTFIPAGANDSCTSPLPVQEGATFISNAGCTDTVGGCPSLKDAWYSFAVPSTGVYYFALRSADFPAGFSVYANCTTSIAVQCQGSSPISVNLSAGTTVLVRVGAYPVAGNPPPSQTGTALLVIQRTDLPAAQAFPYRLTSSYTDELLLADGPLLPSILLREGAAPPYDPAVLLSSMSFPTLGPGINVAMTHALLGPVRNQITVAALSRAHDDTMDLVEREDPAAVPEERWKLAPIVAHNEQGHIAYAHLDGETIAYAHATLHALQANPRLPDAVTFAHFDQPAQASNGAVAFRARLSGAAVTDTNNHVVMIDPAADASTLEILARTGSPADPFPAGSTVTELGIEPAASPLAVAWWERASGPDITPANDTAWLAHEFASAQRRIIAREGDPVPAVPGALLGSLPPRIAFNEPGAAALTVTLVGPPATPDANSAILFVPPAGDPSLIAREGDEIPALGAGVRYAVFSDPVMNNHEAIAFTASLRGPAVTQTTSRALFLARPGAAPIPVVRTGDTVTFAKGDARTVRDIELDVGRTDQGQGSLSNVGEAVYTLHFTDTSAAIFVSSILCTADYNHDTIVNTQDFFDFLTDFFAGNADINHDSVTNSQDFFDYLAAFFTGC